MTKKIRFKSKRLITTLLAFLIRATGSLFVALKIFFSIFRKPANAISNLFFRTVVLRLYGKYLLIKNQLSKRASTFGEKVLVTIGNKYFIHVILILLSSVVIIGNLKPSGNNQDYGQNALIFKIMGVENTEMIEDTTSATDESKVYSYFGENSQIDSDVFTESQKQAQQLYDQQSNNGTLTTMQDGSTLSKPEFIGTDDVKNGSHSIREYVVQAGDTIGKVATSFNISINTILWANNLSFTSYIKEGQKLVIPPTSGVLHKIVRGDTISKIAKLYGASEQNINDFNKIENGGLKAGETIMVPGGRIIYTPKPSNSGTAYNNQTGQSSTVRVNAGDIPASSGGRMYWPSACQRISQYYRGWLHTGVDIACPWGTSVRAAESGIVERVQYGKTGYGYNIIINHGGGKETLYGHLSKIMVKAGDRVVKGQLIANEGSTGRSTGPHLHFEVRINGAMVNPLSYIR